MDWSEDGVSSWRLQLSNLAEEGRHLGDDDVLNVVAVEIWVESEVGFVPPIRDARLRAAVSALTRRGFAARRNPGPTRAC